MSIQSYIITGPTASGKSALAHRMAQLTGGVIINCDSVQIYRGIENISASPFAGRAITDEIDGVPYKLFSCLDLSQQLSVMAYLDRARDAYFSAVNENRPAIFVGGTGFYIDAIVRGISPMPDIAPAVRHQARGMVDKDIDAVRRRLGPDAPIDPQRLGRSLEVLMATGRPITDWHQMPRQGAIVPTPKRILINPPRDVLLERIRDRIPEMLNGGAMDEAQMILDMGWNENRAIGAIELCRYLRAEIDRDTAINNWIVRTNQYAKRQRTWFRTQFCPDIEIASADADASELI